MIPRRKAILPIWTVFIDIILYKKKKYSSLITSVLGLFVTMVLPSLVYIGDVRNPSLLMLWTCEEVLGETTCMCVYSCSHVQ